jgi:hypothetical protein
LARLNVHFKLRDINAYHSGDGTIVNFVTDAASRYLERLYGPARPPSPSNRMPWSLVNSNFPDKKKPPFCCTRSNVVCGRLGEEAELPHSDQSPTPSFGVVAVRRVGSVMLAGFFLKSSKIYQRLI